MCVYVYSCVCHNVEAIRQPELLLFRCCLPCFMHSLLLSWSPPSRLVFQRFLQCHTLALTAFLQCKGICARLSPTQSYTGCCDADFGCQLDITSHLGRRSFSEGLPPSDWPVGVSLGALYLLLISMGRPSPLWVLPHTGTGPGVYKNSSWVSR